MIFRLFFLICFYLLTQRLFADIREKKDYALFFVVEDYASQSGAPKLDSALNSAQTLAKTLEDLFYFETYIFLNSTKKDIFQVLANWQQLDFDKDSQILIFFLCKGKYRPLTQKGYLIPHAADDSFESYIDMSDLYPIINQIPCEHIMLALDVGYIGEAFREINFKGKIEWSRPGDTNAAQQAILVEKLLSNKSRILIVPDASKEYPGNNFILTWSTINCLNQAIYSQNKLVTMTYLQAHFEKIGIPFHFGTFTGDETGGIIFLADNKNTRIPKTYLEGQRPISNIRKNTIEDQQKNQYPVIMLKDKRFWLGANLNTNLEGSFCYQDSLTCDKNGRLYLYTAARIGCQSLGPDWRLPTKAEWERVILLYRNEDLNAKSNYEILKKAFANNFGLIGFKLHNSGYMKNGEITCYWASDIVIPNHLFKSFRFQASYKAQEDTGNLEDAFSVRCIQN